MRRRHFVPIALVASALALAVAAMVLAETTTRGVLQPAPRPRLTPIPEDTPRSIRATGVYPGDLAPDFRLATLELGEIRLSDYRGQKVLLNFFTTWCEPCRLEMPGVQSQYEAHQEHGWVVIGIDMFESLAEVDAFRDEFGLTFPIALDLNGNVSRTYEIRGTPTSIVIDEQGRVVDRRLGYMSEDEIEEMLEAVP